MNKARVLLADDHEVTQEWVRLALNDEFEIVGVATNGCEAVSEVRRLDPDVLVIDVSMPILNGLQATALLGANCRTKVVILTLHGTSDFVKAAFSAGASAFVYKSDLNWDLVQAIREVLQGRTYVSRSLSR